MPAIEGFAEIGDYIDQQCAFTPAACNAPCFQRSYRKRPDILIVDEALSVGDAYFHTRASTASANFATGYHLAYCFS